MIILRITNTNKRLRGLFFLFRMLRTSTIFILGCSPNNFSRVQPIFIHHEIYIPCLLQHTYSVTKLLCDLRVPFQLASPPGFHVANIPKGNLVYILAVGNTPYGNRHTSGTISATPLQPILEVRSRQSFWRHWQINLAHSSQEKSLRDERFSTK